MYLTDKITAGQMNISDRQDNSMTAKYIHLQTCKITDRQENSRTDKYIHLKPDEITDRQDNSWKDEYIIQTR